MNFRNIFLSFIAFCSVSALSCCSLWKPFEWSYGDSLEPSNASECSNHDKDCSTSSTGFIEWKKSSNSKTFSSDDFFEFNSPLIRSPLTFEATIEIPKAMNNRGGIIFGNFGDDSNVIINFEIYSNGYPRLYYKNLSYVEDIVFDAVNLNLGKKLHLSIVNSVSNNKMLCYVDGNLEQVVPVDLDIFASESDMRIGGDYRPDNSQYFKGNIFNFAIFSSERTPDEIILDTMGVNTKSETLLAAFDLCDLEKGAEVNSLNNSYTLSNGGLVDNFARPTDFAYSFAIVGDTQIVNRYWSDDFSKIYDFIIGREKSDKIVCCIGLGDITDENTDEEWIRASQNIKRMDYKIPYILNRGNHDGSTQFNKYFASDTYYKSIMDGFYNDSKIENAYKTLNVGLQKYLILALDYGPSDNILNWASRIIEHHPNHRVIVTTHAYLFRDGTTLDENDVCPPSTSGGVNNGDQIWDKLIRKYNIDLVLCGHDPTRHIVISKDANDNGFLVNQLLINPQGIDITDPKGMVALLYFSSDGNKIDVRYYSTIKNKWLKKDCKRIIVIE